MIDFSTSQLVDSFHKSILTEGRDMKLTVTIPASLDESLRVLKAKTRKTLSEIATEAFQRYLNDIQTENPETVRGSDSTGKGGQDSAKFRAA